MTFIISNYMIIVWPLSPLYLTLNIYMAFIEMIPYIQYVKTVFHICHTQYLHGVYRYDPLHSISYQLSLTTSLPK